MQFHGNLICVSNPTVHYHQQSDPEYLGAAGFVMKEQTSEVVYRIVVIFLLWGAFWIASLGDISMLSLVLGILIAVIGILLVGLPGTPPPVIKVYPRDIYQGSMTSLSDREENSPLQGELVGLRNGHMLEDGGGWFRYPLPDGAFQRQGMVRQAALAPPFGGEEEHLLGIKLGKFETTWELAMKEFDPGPRDVLLSSTSKTRLAEELLSGFAGPFEKYSSLGVTGNIPEDILILREVVETRAAPDRTVYQRTIQVLMHKDGTTEYRVLGKEPVTGRPQYEKGIFASS